MEKIFLRAFILGGLCAAFFAQPVFAAESAEDIILKVEANQLFDTSRIEAALTVTNRFGITENEFTSYARKGGDTLVEITSGPDRGQKVLRQKNNIYLFYPDAEEVIWLKGSALKDSMMGSDFSYEDLTNDKTILDRYSVSLGEAEEVDGFPCYRLTLTAKAKTETYAKQELWVDAKLFVARKALLYSASGKAIREMLSSDVRPVAGKNIAHLTVMKDLLKKSTSTAMKLVRVEIGLPLSEKYFNRDELSW